MGVKRVGSCSYWCVLVITLRAAIAVTSPSQIKNDQSRHEALANCWAQRSVPFFTQGGRGWRDVTAIASVAAVVYSICNVAWARNDRAPVQIGAPAVCGESNSIVCLFTQKGRYYCSRVNVDCGNWGFGFANVYWCQLVEIYVLVAVLVINSSGTIFVSS